MQSVDYEKFVEAYLLSTRSVFVAPQFLIRVNGRDRWVDILAADLAAKQFLLVEVSESRRPGGLTEKLKDFHQHRGWLADRLSEEFALMPMWTVKPWIFVRRDSKDAFKKSLLGVGLESGTDYELTPLEQIAERADSHTESYTLKPLWGPLSKKDDPAERARIGRLDN